MTPEIQLQILEIVILILGAGVFWANTRNRRTDASTAVIAADAKQADAVTALALMNNQERIAAQQERQFMQEQVSVLREAIAATKATNVELQGRLDRLQVKYDASETQARSLEKQMSELTQARTADQTIIAEMKAEIISLNKTIAARDETIKGLEKRINELYERVIGTKTSTSQMPAVSGGAIPIDITATGTITATPTLETPPQSSAV